MARALLSRVNRFLGAPVPVWVQYRDDQRRMLGSPELVEAMFSKGFGPDIPDDYAARFHGCLDGLGSWVDRQVEGLRAHQQRRREEEEEDIDSDTNEQTASESCEEPAADEAYDDEESIRRLLRSVDGTRIQLRDAKDYWLDLVIASKAPSAITQWRQIEEQLTRVTKARAAFDTAIGEDRRARARDLARVGREVAKYGKDLPRRIGDWYEEGRKWECCVVGFAVGMSEKQSSLYLDSVTVRPCAEGLGIFKAIVRAIQAKCIQHGLRFLVENPLRRTRELLEKMFGTGTPAHLYLYWYELPTTPPLPRPQEKVWPAAEVLNSQELSDARGPGTKMP